MNNDLTSAEHSARQQLSLLTAIEAHARRTNELLYAMLNREQRQAFDAAAPVAKGEVLAKA